MVIDEVKEEIGYLKLWLGVVVVTNIGLIGWSVSHFEQISSIKTALSVLSILFLSILILPLDRQIESFARDGYTDKKG